MNAKFNLKHIFIFFIDGIGLLDIASSNGSPISNGKEGLFYNILSQNNLLNNEIDFSIGKMKPIDACLNVNGLPQSATGQTALFTGVNTAKELGYHLPGYPNSRLREIIKEKSLFKILKAKGLNITNMNLYSEEYFEYIKRLKKNLLSVSTLLFIEANFRFRLLEKYDTTNAVFMDLTNKILYERGHNIQIISPRKAGLNASNIIKSHDVSFFEYFLTDKCGHRGNKEWAKQIIKELNQYLETILSDTCLDDTAIFIVSDHGNFEDLNNKPHTRNPIPFIVFSSNSELTNYCTQKVNTLPDFYYLILDLIKK